MRRPVQERTIFSITNPNKAWVVNELDKIRGEWADWSKFVANLEDSPDYDPKTCSVAVKDGYENLRAHEVLREKTLTFIGNNFSGYDFLLSGWPNHPHESVTTRLARRVGAWNQRLEILAATIEYARVPDGFWTEQGKQFVTTLAKTTPDKAVEIAASWLKNPTG